MFLYFDVSYTVYYQSGCQKKKKKEKKKEKKKKNSMLLTFKKWPFPADFNIKTQDRKLPSVVCKYCSEVDYNDFMWEARYQNIYGSALKSIKNFQTVF